jgi:alpha-tubulin suppressor-like RCC1 family protein
VEVNISDVVDISTGQSHTVALKSDGKLYSWGANTNGQLGDGTTTQRPFPVPVNMNGTLSNKTIRAVAAGNYFTVVLTTDGLLFAFGQNDAGQLGVSLFSSLT